MYGKFYLNSKFNYNLVTSKKNSFTLYEDIFGKWININASKMDMCDLGSQFKNAVTNVCTILVS